MHRKMGPLKPRPTPRPRRKKQGVTTITIKGAPEDEVLPVLLYEIREAIERGDRVAFEKAPKLVRNGLYGKNETRLALHVPDEYCIPGFVVPIAIRGDGISIGGELIEWGEVEIAKLRARGCEI